MALSVQQTEDPKEALKRRLYIIGAPGTQGGDAASQTNDSSISNPFAGMQMGSAPTVTAPTAVRDTTNISRALNTKYQEIDRGLQRQETDAGLSRTNALAALDRKYRDQQSDAQGVQENARRQLLERMSTSGILNSGITVGEQGKQNEAYLKWQRDLNNWRASGIGDVENQYANFLNNVAGQREGLYLQQTREEEARRLAEEQARAQAEAARVQAEQMRAFQEEQARIAAENQRRMMDILASQQPKTVNVGSLPGVSSGGGGGGGGMPAPTGTNATDPNANFALPSGFFSSQGGTQEAINSWLINNLDASLKDSPNALNDVRDALVRTRTGLPLSQLANIIANARLWGSSPGAI